MSSTATCTCMRFMVSSFGRSSGITSRSAHAIAPAAVFGEIGDEPVHRREVGGIDELAAQPALGDEAGMNQLLQVKGKRRRRDADRLGDEAGREAFRAFLD